MQWIEGNVLSQDILNPVVCASADSYSAGDNEIKDVTLGSSELICKPAGRINITCKLL